MNDIFKTCLACGNECRTNKQFGELLVYLRKRAGLNQGEFSRSVGYSQSYMCKIEHNQRRPTKEIVERLFIRALTLSPYSKEAELLMKLAE